MKKSYSDIIKEFANKKILVVGDLILDQHIRGQVSRISPEAPVPVVHQQGEPTYAPGGAANVGANLSSLGAKVLLIGRIGNDLEGNLFLKELDNQGINGDGVFVDKSIPTIVKTRIVAQHQQVLRLDREKLDTTIDAKLTQKILNFIKKHIKTLDGVIISDYGKGVVTPDLVTALCALAQENKKIISVDPKDDHFNYYRGVTTITPNKKEAENAIRNIKITQKSKESLSLTTDKLESFDSVVEAGGRLLKYLKLESLLITLGEEGMCLFEKGKKPKHIHTRAKDVYDVTGAGDTVISVFTLSLAVGADKFQAADLANYAAGIVVGQMGAVAITIDDLKDIKL